MDFESFGEWQVRQALYPDGHNSLIATMKKLRPKCIIMEATGVYYFDLAVALVEAGLPVAVIPPQEHQELRQYQAAEQQDRQHRCRTAGRVRHAHGAPFVDTTRSAPPSPSKPRKADQPPDR